MRATSAKLIGDIGRVEHVDRLVELLLADPDPVPRQRAAEAMSALGGVEARPALEQGLDDPMDPVRLACVDGLRKLGAGEAIQPLARLLREDAVWEIRARAARALGGSDAPEAISALEAALDDPNEFVRSAAAHALRMDRGAKGP